MAELTNAGITDIPHEMLKSPVGQSPALKRHISLLTGEEQQQKESLPRQIRMQATRLTLRQPALVD